MADRECDGRNTSPIAVIIDSRSVKTIGADGSRNYDSGKKVKCHEGKQIIRRRNHAHECHDAGRNVEKIIAQPLARMPATAQCSAETVGRQIPPLRQDFAPNN